MELCQGDNTPSKKQTNQENTSRGRHKIFNKWKTNTMQQALNGTDKITKWLYQWTVCLFERYYII